VRPNGALVAALAAAALSTSPPSLAQDALPVTDPELVAGVEEAELRGRLLWLYDQAAWHATDALLADIDPSTIENPRGYVVVPGAVDGTLETIFVAEQDGALREFARYSVRETKVEGGGPVSGELPALSPLAERLFRAREPALAAMAEQGYGLCSRESPNTLALPPDEDRAIAFYLLTSTREAGIYPIGGHYRADVGPDGSVAATRRYMNTCFDLPTAPQRSPDGGVGHAGVSYLFGDVPSEIHVFASFQFENGFMVIAQSSRKLWLVKDGEVTLIQEDFGPAE
jgi:hypothetical protein